MRTVGLRGEGQEAVATSFTIGDTVEITWRPDRPVRVDARMYEGHRADVHPLYQVASYFRARWSVMTKPSSSTRTPLHGGTGNTGGNSGWRREELESRNRNGFKIFDGSIGVWDARSAPLKVEGGVPQDLPEVAVGVAEIARVDAPGTVVRWRGQRRSGRFGLGEQRIHRSLVSDRVADAELAAVGGAWLDRRVLCQLRARPHGKDEAVLQLEHRHGPGGIGVVADELGADNSGRLQAEPVAIELDRSIEVVDGEGDDVDAGLHAGCSFAET